MLPTKKLERVHRLANSYAEKKIATLVDRLENALLEEGAVRWSVDKVRREIGQEIALAYAMGALDRTENKDLIVT